jgi:hypothetical protein
MDFMFYGFFGLGSVLRLGFWRIVRLDSVFAEDPVSRGVTWCELARSVTCWRHQLRGDQP